MARHLILHGHFYQPPRENPWLEAIERQGSAEPYHDWNERITAECYAPNATSRILSADGRIERIVNNYARISFNFGPTLASWLEAKAPEVHAALLAADAASSRRFSGHGNALAQAYNHIILPLANRRDKETQIAWGLADFAHRFGRQAEGMWLPETAVDVESLEVLAAHGVRFTILAPHQAKRVRPLGEEEEEWREVGGDGLDTTVPYRVALPSGREIAVFFYNGVLSRAVAFEGLLADGERFAARLLSGFPAEDDPAVDRLVHIATDGETYGHHHRHGEMALSYALHHLEERGLVRLTNYGEYLELHPPVYEAEIVPNTAWSCAHGVGRWTEDCGCHAGAPPGWNQAWRKPLRLALDGLRDRLAERFAAAGAAFFADPWAARDGYSAVLLDRSEASDDAFLDRHRRAGAGAWSKTDRVAALKLLEMQRNALLMFTSCGWFFNDISGIEGVQILCYAGRAVQLARDLFGDDGGEGALLAGLALAHSNDPRQGNGREIYLRAVKPAEIDLPHVGAHYAVASLFTDFPEVAQVYCYRVERETWRTLSAGRARLSVGRAEVASSLTGKALRLDLAAVHFGDHNLSAGVRPALSDPADRQKLDHFFEEAKEAFENGDLPQVVRLFDAYFQPAAYSLTSLLADDRRTILRLVLAATLDEVEDEYRDIVRHHAPLIRSLARGRLPVPRALSAAAELVLNLDLERTLKNPDFDLDAVRHQVEEAQALGVVLDGPRLGYAATETLVAWLLELREEPEDVDRLRRAEALVALARDLPFTVDLAQAQNLGYAMRETHYPEWQKEAESGDPEAVERVILFRALGKGLALAVE